MVCRLIILVELGDAVFVVTAPALSFSLKKVLLLILGGLQTRRRCGTGRVVVEVVED